MYGHVGLGHLVGSLNIDMSSSVHCIIKPEDGLPKGRETQQLKPKLIWVGLGKPDVFQDTFNGGVYNGGIWMCRERGVEIGKCLPSGK